MITPRTKDNIDVVVKQKQELTLLGSIRRRRRLFIFMKYEGVVSKVQMEQSTIDIDGNKKNRIDVVAGAQYIQALNLKNAIKKFNKQ